MLDCKFCCAAGAVAIAYTVLRILSFVKLNFLTSVNMKKRYGAAGDWAVVTGGTEGIGHAMAIDLSRRGFNVCIIARTQSKLDAVAKEVEANKTQAMTISFDFGTATEEQWTSLEKQLGTISIAVLVNNVGVNYDYTNYFQEVPVETDLRLLKVNTEATVRMTKMVLPHMKSARTGAILMLGSFSAVTPTPLLATYAGTKAFNISFGTSLHYELKQFGIDVLAVSPNMVVSKMTQGRSRNPPRESFLTVNAARMAHQTLNQLGSVPVTAGHRNHAIIEGIVKLLPVNFISGKVLAMHKSVKKRAERPRS